VKLFNPRLIESVYEVTEYAFDSRLLRDIMRRNLNAAGVEVRLSKRVERVETRGRTSRVMLSDGSEVDASYVFNCACTRGSTSSTPPRCGGGAVPKVFFFCNLDELWPALLEWWAVPPGAFRTFAMIAC